MERVSRDVYREKPVKIIRVRSWAARGQLHGGRLMWQTRRLVPFLERLTAIVNATSWRLADAEVKR